MSRKSRGFIAAGVVLALVFGAGIYKARKQEAEGHAIEQGAAPLLAALERYKADKGAYPKDTATLVPAYIAAHPACPGLSRPMSYAYSEEEKGFEVYCPTGWLLKHGYRSVAGAWSTYE